MRQAVREGLVPKNVVADVTPPKLVKTREANPLDKTEAGLYLAALKDNRLYAGFVVELTTGLRRGELIGLHWSDIQNGVLKIRRQVSRVKHDDGSSSLEYTDLKTPSSYRSIVLPTITIAELKAHKARQAQEKLLAGKTYKDEGLIFCNTIGQKLDTRRFYSIHSDTLKKIGLKHRAFHDLRHSVASLLLQAGESIKTVQDIMGHADADTLMNVYAHLFEEMKQSAADKLDSIFAEPVPLEKTEGAVEEDIVVI